MNDGLELTSERGQREWEAQERALLEERSGARDPSDRSVAGTSDRSAVHPRTVADAGMDARGRATQARAGMPEVEQRREQLPGAVAEYRLVARALRNPPLAPLPSDFAARTAARARVLRAAGEHVEIWLERGLVALLLIAGAAALFVYNGDWLREIELSVPEGAAMGVRAVASWIIAAAACVGISSAFSLSRKP